jgi:hypothetical protein
MLEPPIHPTRSGVIIAILGFALLSGYGFIKTFEYIDLKNTGSQLSGEIEKTRTGYKQLLSIDYTYVLNRKLVRGNIFSFHSYTKGAAVILYDYKSDRSCPKIIIGDVIIGVCILSIFGLISMGLIPRSSAARNNTDILYE